MFIALAMYCSYSMLRIRDNCFLLSFLRNFAHPFRMNGLNS